MQLRRLQRRLGATKVVLHEGLLMVYCFQLNLFSDLTQLGRLTYLRLLIRGHEACHMHGLLNTTYTYTVH